MAKIIYTHTDEAPMLATHSLLPIIEAFASTAGVEVETRDISLSGRIIAAFGDYLRADQRIDDALAELGELTQDPEANIIKLPNISASIPQLKAAVAELQAQGYAIPNYPDDPSSDAEKDIRGRFDRIKGSAVNPVLRQGNSDRRAPASVKNFARSHPHSMGEWSPDSKTNVAHMNADDFRSNEKSVIIEADDTLKIQLVGDDGTTDVLGDSIPVLAGEIVDGTVLSVAALKTFLAEQIERAKREDVLFSVHLKATMMKISDPLIFGHVIEVFFPELFEKYGDELVKAGLDPANGLAAILSGLDALPANVRDDVSALITKGLEQGPALAMVDSDRGITNLHVPSDVIVDASMPAMIRTSGKMWGPDGAPRGHARGHPRQQLRRRLPDGARRLPCQRRLRPDHHGLGAERRPHGAGGGGVRQPRQDVRDCKGRYRSGRRQQWAGADRAPRRAEGHLARLPDQGHPGSQLDRTRRGSRPRLQHSCGVLARQDPGPRREPHRQGHRAPEGPRHRGTADRDYVAGGGDRVLAEAHPQGRGHHFGDRQRSA
jgi:hypothetical protein